MSSAFRSPLSIPTSSQGIHTKFVNLTTLCYEDVSGFPVPIPYTYSNGVLDINIQDNVLEKLVSGTGTLVPFRPMNIKNGQLAESQLAHFRPTGIINRHPQGAGL